MSAFNALFPRAITHLTTTITDKTSDFFELADYDWTPSKPDSQSSLYLWDMVNWLMSAVDELSLPKNVKDAAYRGALAHIADCFMVRLPITIYHSFVNADTSQIRHFYAALTFKPSTKMGSQISLLMWDSWKRNSRNLQDRNLRKCLQSCVR